jgi:hypothetical protein
VPGPLLARHSILLTTLLVRALLVGHYRGDAIMLPPMEAALRKLSFGSEQIRREFCAVTFGHQCAF